MRLRSCLSSIAILFLLTGCDGGSSSAAVGAPGDLPVTQWDFRPEAETWSEASIAALKTHGAPLLASVPADIETYCPDYASLDANGRAAFWTTFLSALAKHESTWRPEAAGGGGRWHGLLQISPATAQGYGCRATTASALQVGAANLSCAIRIMSVTVPRDGVISAGGGGVAADWGPFSSPAKRADIQDWTRNRRYCS